MVGVTVEERDRRTGGAWVADIVSRAVPSVSASERAFDTFARASGDRLLRSAYLLTGNHATAQDLVQSALTTTWTHWSRLREPAAAEAYARRCMARTSASWWRRKWRGEVSTGELPESGVAADDVATSVAVLSALSLLDHRARSVLVLRFFDDLSEADTAAALGISVGTVKSRTSRALVKLRELDVWEELR